LGRCGGGVGIIGEGEGEGIAGQKERARRRRTQIRILSALNTSLVQDIERSREVWVCDEVLGLIGEEEDALLELYTSTVPPPASPFPHSRAQSQRDSSFGSDGEEEDAAKMWGSLTPFTRRQIRAWHASRLPTPTSPSPSPPSPGYIRTLLHRFIWIPFSPPPPPSPPETKEEVREWQGSWTHLTHSRFTTIRTSSSSIKRWVGELEALSSSISEFIPR